MLTAKKALLGDTVVMRKLIECLMSQQSSDFKSEFEKPMRELLPFLSSCEDGCPNTHYGKVVHELKI